MKTTEEQVPRGPGPILNGFHNGLGTLGASVNSSGSDAAEPNPFLFAGIRQVVAVVSIYGAIAAALASMLYSKERLEHCRRAGRIEGFIAVASGQLKLASRIGAPLGRAPPLARDAGHLQSGVRPLSGILRLHKTTDPEATRTPESSQTAVPVDVLC